MRWVGDSVARLIGIAMMTSSSHCAPFQTRALIRLQDPTGTLHPHPPLQKLYQGRFKSPPSPSKRQVQTWTHPRVAEDDINKLGLTSDNKDAGWEGKENIFSPLNGAVNNHFSAERWSRRAGWRFFPQSKAEGKHHYHRKHYRERRTSRPSQMIISYIPRTV